MSAARGVWKKLNEGVFGYIFYIILGVVAALAVTSVLGIALETSIPLVAVVSGSMDHGVNDEGNPCGKSATDYEESFDGWWDLCDSTYGDFGIAREQFSNFPFSGGMKKGDIVVIQNNGEIEVGDVIVYNIPSQSVPIIHRVVSANADGTYQTKGDHNSGQNAYEHSVQKTQIRGKAIFLMPYLGYLRVLIPIS